MTAITCYHQIHQVAGSPSSFHVRGVRLCLTARLEEDGESLPLYPLSAEERGHLLLEACCILCSDNPHFKHDMGQEWPRPRLPPSNPQLILFLPMAHCSDQAA